MLPLLKSVRAILIFLIVCLTLFQTTTVVEAMPDPEMCQPSIFDGENGSFHDRFPVADDAFDKKKYQLAFRAYYQYFFCFMGSGETINPAAEDSGAATLLQLSISAAARGNYPSAVAQATSSIKLDPRLGEAQFIIGDIDWILGKHVSARAFWQAAAENTGYPAPPHDVTTESPLSLAARRMLRTHR